MPSSAGPDPFMRIPQAPSTLHPLALEILKELSGHAESANVIIGGGVALQHYFDFRPTIDLDAWWSQAPDEATRSAIAEAVSRVAIARGDRMEQRGFGDTESFEIVAGGRKVFALQIARRSVQLDPPLESGWAPVKLESLRDNVGAKMNALVNRGAPRDFIDIFNLCHRGGLTADDCWKVWQAKNPGRPLEQGVAAARTRLQEIESRRPLESIGDDAQRTASRELREWVAVSFCRPKEIIRKIESEGEA